MPASYSILGGIATGGMATVYLGRMTASAGFTRLVAIKRLHPELATDKDFVAMLVDEARLAGQIRHPNVIDTLDLFVSEGAFSLVLEYVEGASLSALARYSRKLKEPIPLPIVVAIIQGILRGLDAAHGARGDDGTPLGIVHRDVSPQNVLVGVDGIPRLIDFGIAKASGRIMSSTRPGEVRGKFAYMAPEQLLGRPVTRQADVYAVGVLLWEALTGQRLFTAEDERAVCAAVLRGEIKPPSSESNCGHEIPSTFDAIIARATARDLADRYLTAREMLTDLESLAITATAPAPRASDDDVGAWVRRLAAQPLAERQKVLARSASAPVEIDEVMNHLARSLEHVPVPDSQRSVESAAMDPAPLPSMSVAPISASGSGIGVAIAPPSTTLATTRSRIVIAAIAGVSLLGLVALTVFGITHRAPQSSMSNATTTTNETPTAPTEPAAVLSVELTSTADPTPAPTPTPSAAEAKAATAPSKSSPRRITRTASPRPSVKPSTPFDPKAER